MRGSPQDTPAILVIKFKKRATRKPAAWVAELLLLQKTPHCAAV